MDNFIKLSLECFTFRRLLRERTTPSLILIHGYEKLGYIKRLRSDEEKMTVAKNTILHRVAKHAVTTNLKDAIIANMPSRNGIFLNALMKQCWNNLNFKPILRTSL